MSKVLRGRPAPGKLVRDPAHDFNPVPETVADYPADPYWRRRFAQGDMINEEPSIAAVAPEPTDPGEGSAGVGEAAAEGETPSTRNRRGA